jgi:hypothetical protein
MGTRVAPRDSVAVKQGPSQRVKSAAGSFGGREAHEETTAGASAATLTPGSAGNGRGVHRAAPAAPRPARSGEPPLSRSAGVVAIRAYA